MQNQAQEESKAREHTKVRVEHSAMNLKVYERFASQESSSESDFSSSFSADSSERNTDTQVQSRNPISNDEYGVLDISFSGE